MAQFFPFLVVGGAAYGLYKLYGWRTRRRERLRELATEYLRTTLGGTSYRLEPYEKRVLSGVMEIYRKRAHDIDVDETFERQEYLGEGAFGKVYKWVIRKNGLSVAGKEVPLIRVSRTDTLLNEAEQLSELDHQNIITFYGAFRDSKKGNAYLFMELMETSVGILARQNPIPEHTACAFTLDILHGLLYLYDRQLHGKEIIHCDIKGDNILVNAEGIAKLADFGLSKNVDHEQGYGPFSSDRKGTIYFISPEILDEARNGKRSDVWALGCTIYEMLEQRPPFSDLNEPGIKRSIQNMDHRDLVQRMRATDGAKRFLRSIFVKLESRPYPSDLLKDSWFHTNWD